MPGQCPMMAPEDEQDDCEEECSSDMDCYMEEPGSKCCNYGCRKKCMRPVTGTKKHFGENLRMGNLVI